MIIDILLVQNFIWHYPQPSLSPKDQGHGLDVKDLHLSFYDLLISKSLYGFMNLGVKKGLFYEPLKHSFSALP